MSIQEKAIEAVISFHKATGEEIENAHAIDTCRSFCNGKLVTIEFSIEEKGKIEDLVNYVYVVNDDYRVYMNDEDLISALKGEKGGFFASLSSSEHLAGIMALLIVVALVALTVAAYVNGDVESKKVLSQTLASGFALVLGFYFGKSTA